MNRPFKIALSVGALLALACVGLTLFLVGQLPGPKEIGRALKPKDESPKVYRSTVAVPQSGATAAAEVTRPTEPAPSEAQQKKFAAEKIIFALLEEDPREIHVCEHLGKGSMSLKDFENDKVGFDKMFGPEGTTNPVALAMRVPIRSIFQDEHVASLLKDLLAEDPSKMDQDEKSSFLQKIDFYGRTAFAAAHLYERKKDFETQGDRAVHLAVLARIAGLKPELASTSLLQDSCSGIEQSLAQGEQVDVKAERQTILDTIKAAGLTPKEVDFDPESYMNFKVKFGDNSFTFSLDGKEQT